MNPEKRTLLQVKVEDFVDADEIFTLLMVKKSSRAGNSSRTMRWKFQRWIYRLGF
jgi:DNA gyrase/topoisomerase IV subunit B